MICAGNLNFKILAGNFVAIFVGVGTPASAFPGRPLSDQAAYLKFHLDKTAITNNS